MHSNLPWCFDAVLTERAVCIPGQCGRDSYFLRSATSHSRWRGGGGGRRGGVARTQVTWTRVVYEIESETLSNYKNLREKLLDQIDDINI